MEQVRWGVLGNAKIAREKVIPALQRATNCRVEAVASRESTRAHAMAASLGVARAHGSYEALLDDSGVDAVYVPLPNHLHVDWAIRALEAGKHVLCEKPIGLDTADAQRLQDAARAYPRLKVMEAFMYRFHPQWQRALTLVREGAIGALRTVHTAFSYHNTVPENIRNRVDAGGGALMDIGCYGISVGRFLFEREPARVFGKMDLDPRFGTDRQTSGILDFESGTATFTCSTQLVPHQRVEVFGTQGRIEIVIPFNAPPEEPCLLLVQRGKETEEVVTPAVDQYTLQGERFADAILRDTPVPTPLTDALANMKVIDAMRESADTGRWATRA